MLRSVAILLVAGFVQTISASLPSRLSAPADVQWATESTADIYDRLLDDDAAPRSRKLLELPPGRQSALWAHHLLTNLAEHPELTTSQREAIQEALAVLTPELFAIDPSDPRWPELVGRPLQQLAANARGVFPGSLARQLFGQLGPDRGRREIDRERAGPMRQLPSTPAIEKHPKTTLNGYPECECSTGYGDWCPGSSLDFTECRHTWCVFRSRGCGWFLLQACEGMCFVKQREPT